MSDRSLIGVVLAGGLSSRMGQDKALLRWQGKPLIEHQQAILEASGVETVYVSGYRPNYHGIADALPQRGPIGGLAGIAQHLAGTVQLLVVPVDMPRLTPAILTPLLSQPQVDCVRYRQRMLPMSLRLDVATRSVLETLLHHKEPKARSLRALQQQLKCHELVLSGSNAALLVDCNTREKWSEINHADSV